MVRWAGLRWLRWVVPVAIFVEGGPFASDGIYGFVVLGAFLLWTLLTSVILVQRLRQIGTWDRKDHPAIHR